MKARFGGRLVLIAAIGISLFPRTAVAGTSEASRKALTRLFLGKEVKPLLQLPASKEGIDIYYSRKGDRIDERGPRDVHLDLGLISLWSRKGTLLFSQIDDNISERPDAGREFSVSGSRPEALAEDPLQGPRQESEMIRFLLK